jgi:hypothetical protein
MTTTTDSRPREHKVGQVVRKFRVLLQHLPAADLEQLSNDLDDALRTNTRATERPSVRKHLLRQTIGTQADEYRVRHELLADSLTAPQVAQRLGTSRQTPHDRARAGTLLAVMDRGVLRFPAWQFDPAGPDGVLAGLPEVLRALGEMPPLSKMGWMVSPKALLPDSPVALLRRGTPEARREVVLAAESARRL